MFFHAAKANVFFHAAFVLNFVKIIRVFCVILLQTK